MPADTAERATLLERLFDTGRFGRIEEWFSTERRDAGTRLREREDQVRQHRARVAESAGSEGIGEDAAWLADIRDRLADVADLAAEAAVSARQRRDRIAEELGVKRALA